MCYWEVKLFVFGHAVLHKRCSYRSVGKWGGAEGSHSWEARKGSLPSTWEQRRVVVFLSWEGAFVAPSYELAVCLVSFPFLKHKFH